MDMVIWLPEGLCNQTFNPLIGYGALPRPQAHCPSRGLLHLAWLLSNSGLVSFCCTESRFWNGATSFQIHRGQVMLKPVQLDGEEAHTRSVTSDVNLNENLCRMICVSQ